MKYMLTKARWTMVVCALFAFTQSERANAQFPDRALPGETWAYVSPDKVTVFFPLPFERLSAPSKPFAGFYAWMFTVEEGAAGFSVVLASDTAMRTNDIDEIVKNSKLRLCADITPTNVRTCKLALNAKATALAGYLEIVITDKALVGRLLKEYPMEYWRYVYEPNGFYRIDRKRFQYYNRARRYR